MDFLHDLQQVSGERYVPRVLQLTSELSLWGGDGHLWVARGELEDYVACNFRTLVECLHFGGMRLDLGVLGAAGLY